MWEWYTEFIMFSITVVKIMPTIIMIAVIMGLRWLVGGGE